MLAARASARAFARAARGVIVEIDGLGTEGAGGASSPSDFDMVVGDVKDGAGCGAVNGEAIDRDDTLGDPPGSRKDDGDP